MSSEDADGTDIFPFSDHYVFSEKNPEPEFLSVGQSCVPWSEHTGDLLNDVDQMTVFFSPPSPGQTSVSGTGTLTPGLAHSPIFFFYWIFQAALSMKTHTSEVCPSCQFGGQDPSVGTCFLESYPQPKPPSKVQSSQGHLTVGPHRAINLSSPAHLPTIGSLIFYVGSDSKGITA